MPAVSTNHRHLQPLKSVLCAPAAPGEYDGLTKIERVRKRHTGKAEASPSHSIGIAGWKSSAVDVQGRDVSLIANTDDIDMQREVVVPGGAVLLESGPLKGQPVYFAENKSIFLDHRYYFEHLVGKARKCIPQRSGGRAAWRVEVAILSLRGSPICDDILTVASEWGLGASIGFEALEGGAPTPDEIKAYRPNGPFTLEWVTRKWLWLELSITAMPCNVACNTAAERTEKTIVYLDDAVCKGRIRRAAAVALGLPTTPKRKLQPVFLTD